MLESVQNYLKETKSFLTEIDIFFKKEIHTLETSAQAKTRFVTAFLNMIAVKNIRKSIKQIELLESNLQETEYDTTIEKAC